jgi:diadenosine tetraphosphate (Ap4A) HIT family hydrolase
MTGDECVLCRRATTLDHPGPLLRGEHWLVSTHPSVPAPGWVAVQTLRHTEGLSRLDSAEAAELGPLLSRLSAAVTRVTGSERVYTYSLGEGCPHTHILLGPPRRELRGAAFLTGLLHRDDSLADETAAIDVARRLADELADRPHENPTQPTESGERR